MVLQHELQLAIAIVLLLASIALYTSPTTLYRAEQTNPHPQNLCRHMGRSRNLRKGGGGGGGGGGEFSSKRGRGPTTYSGQFVEIKQNLLKKKGGGGLDPLLDLPLG